MPTTSLVQDIETLAAATQSTEARAACIEQPGGGPPSAGNLVRLGTLAGLEFHRLLALLLKHDWERVLAQTLGSDNDALCPPGAEIDLRLLKKRFAPDCETLFDLLSEGGYAPNGVAYDPQSLRETVREMIVLDLHVLAADGPELRAFVERDRQSRALLQDCPADLDRAFRAAKRDWLGLQEELGERLLYLERCRLENENLTQRWLALFGTECIELSEQAARLEGLQHRIDLKLAQPELTREALDRLVAEADAAGRAQRERLRHRLTVATSDIRQPDATPVSAESVSEYRRQSKLALREIWLLIHPDKLAQHASFAQLTAHQKELLGELWHRAMAVRDEELGCAPGYLGHDYRSLTVLLDIVATVREILGNAGFDTDVSLIVKGDTVAEQLAWLRSSIDRVLGELDSVQAELIVLLNDPEHKQRHAMLGAPASKQEQVRREMAQRARDLDAQAQRAAAYLDDLFESADMALRLEGQTSQQERSA